MSAEQETDLTKRAAASFKEWDEKEAKAFSDQLTSQSIGGYQYVAQAARGHDVHGLWHAFPCHGRTGYAAHAVALHSLLEHIGVPTELAPHPSAEIDITRFPRDRDEMLMRWVRTPVGIAHSFISSYPPDIVGVRAGAPTRVSYVAFEAAPVSDYAVKVCNHETLTALWCVSPFTARCYTESGVRADKVKVIVPPVCDGPWKAAVTRSTTGLRATPVTVETPFVFGALGTWHERKGFHHLVRAYFEAFTREDPTLLVLHTSYFGERQPTISQFEAMVVGEIARIAAEFGEDNYPHGKRMPRIKLVTGTSETDEEIVGWLGKLDAYANASFGEGLGIPQIWSLAQGIPVITSDYGAVGELVSSLRADFGRFAGEVFPSKLTPVPRDQRRLSPLLDPNSMWGGYDHKHLAGSMLEAFSRGRLRSNLLAARVQRRFSFEETAPPLRAALKELVSPERAVEWSL